jgi:quercetin dioxygenase-like cupin family protein
MVDTEYAVKTQDELEVAEGTPGIVRRRVFETDNNIMIHATLAAGVQSGWHHHADRHTYGFVVRGKAVGEYGPDRETLELTTGDFYYTAPGVVHSGHNPTDEDTIIIESFVGTGPLVVNVDGPEEE